MIRLLMSNLSYRYHKYRPVKTVVEKRQHEVKIPHVHRLEFSHVIDIFHKPQASNILPQNHEF